MEEKSKAGSFYLAGIGLAVALIGAVFVYLLWNSYSKAKATRGWTETECLVIRSKVKERSAKNITREFSWSIEYIYDFDGVSYTSKLYTLRGSKWGSSRKDTLFLMSKYPKDEKAMCFVNPAEPSEAILEHDSKAAGYSIWFPMLFVIGGLGIMISSLRGFKIKFMPC